MFAATTAVPVVFQRFRLCVRRVYSGLIFYRKHGCYSILSRAISGKLSRCYIVELFYVLKCLLRLDSSLGTVCSRLTQCKPRMRRSFRGLLLLFVYRPPIPSPHSCSRVLFVSGFELHKQRKRTSIATSVRNPSFHFFTRGRNTRPYRACIMLVRANSLSTLSRE